ncbi:hypothetical protein RND71_037182 [Anisodus tanguticus]|uniref:Reverse transcriptase domain-containing protein n=1 Tax=Anisodus tanguticus TaxID=243964 RepID=A0AAE1R393_9SOLA|nr:hypothetical protein RND71_037182 [Anisodus tanguticus]
MKILHDKRIVKREFSPGDLVLLYNSRLKLFSGKLKSRWFSPFKVKNVFSYGAIELKRKVGHFFKVNGQIVKYYLRSYDDHRVNEIITLYEP